MKQATTQFRRAALLALFATLGISSMWSQYSVRGTVSETSGEGVPYATVYVYSAGDTSKVLYSGVTDIDGKLSIDMKKSGNYTLTVSFVGLEPARRTFATTASQPVAELGNIVLATQSNTLGEVVVTSQRQLIKSEIDRLSYNVQADADSKTKTAMDILRKVPLVTVDGQNTIRVKGSTTFKVYKNGHPDAALSANPSEIFRALPASAIKRIEVITDPGAKYDAEGTTAILNVVTDDATGMSGVTGTLQAGIDLFGQPRASAFITAQHKKFTTSINYGYRHANANMLKNVEREDFTHYNASGNELHSRTKMNDGSANVHYGNIEASYEATKRDLLTFSFGGFYVTNGIEGVNATSMNAADNSLLYSYKSIFRQPSSSYYNLNGRADYQHKTSREGESVTLSYLISTTRNKSNQSESYFDIEAPGGSPLMYEAYDGHGNEKLLEHTVQFDWTRPFAQWHTFETGLKYINRLNKSNTTRTYTGAPELDVASLFNHRTQVAAAYLSYSFEHEAWSARAGLRYEYSNLRARFPDGSQEGFHRSLNDWVPSASVAYKFTPMRSLKLSFSTSIQRPGISYLNPAVLETPTSIAQGNPDLASARVYSLGLTFMNIGPKFTFSLNPSLDISSNMITQVQWLDGEKTHTSYNNTLKSRTVSLNGFAQWQATPTTSVNINGSIGREWLRSPSLDITNARWTSNLFAQVSQQLPWKLRLSASGGYWNGGTQGLYQRFTTMGWYSFSLQRSFLKNDCLTVELEANKPFSGKTSSFKMYTIQGDYTGYNSQRFPARQFAINVSFKFGSLQARVKKTDTTITNNDMVGGSSANNASEQPSGGK